MPRYALIFAKGLEDFCRRYLEDNFKIKEFHAMEGILFFDYEGNPNKLSRLRIADDAMFFVKKLAGINRYKTSLRNIRHQAAKSNFQKAMVECMAFRRICKQPSFSIDVDYEGRRDYTAKEALQSVKEGVLHHYGWKYKEKDADLNIRLIVTPTFSFFGMSLNPTQIKEINSIKSLPGSLKCSVANAMLELSHLKPGDKLLDPMCGTGIIPLEAEAFGASAIGGDIDREKISIAKDNKNIRSANSVFMVWDAKDTMLSPGSIDKVVCNLPFGKQIRLENAEGFFSEFIKEMARVSKNDARFAFLTCHSSIIKELLKKPEFRLEKEITLINSGLESTLLVIQKSKKE